MVMPILSYLFLLLMTQVIAPAGSDALLIEILPQSKVSLLGSSNVNTFTCAASVPPASMLVQVTSLPGSQRYNLRNATMQLPIATLDCGNRIMNKDLKKALNAEVYPSIELLVKSVALLQEDEAEVGIDLTVAGCQKPTALRAEISTSSGGELLISGSLPIEMLDFNIEPPTAMLGMVQVKSEILIHFRLALNLNSAEN